MRVGYHCSHEQHAPSRLLANAIAAGHTGFAHAMCSDHFAPWSEREGQGHAGFAWSWLGAALQATSLSFGTVTAPGQRYYPAVLAQAIATLGEMYPGRFWVALGTGEALNEHITGDEWPSRIARRERLSESVTVMRALLRGETVTHEGRVRVHEAKVWSRPAQMPALFGAALSVDTARWVGSWADGLITVAANSQALREMITAFRGGGGEGKPVFVQAAIAHARTESDAEHIARAWAYSGLEDTAFKSDVARVAFFDAASAHLPVEKLREAIQISASPSAHVDWIGEQLACGADRVYVHHVGWREGDQRRFLDELAPQLLSV